MTHINFKPTLIGHRKMKILSELTKTLPLILALSACDSSNSEYVLSNGLMSTPLPQNLRTIPASDLSAEITIDGTTNTYYGTDFPDGVWRIPLDIDPNQTYQLLVAWYANEHVVMEETGTIFSDDENFVIKPDLDFVTIGEDRFDTDCDELSNLVEISVGRDPGNDSLAPCEETVELENPTTPLLPWLAQNFDNYAVTGDINRATSIVQNISIRDTNATEASFYSLVFRSDNVITQSNGSQISPRATLQLIRDPIEGDSLSFFTAQAISVDPANENVKCEPNDQSGFYCRVPFQLSTRQWYSLRFIEESPSHWQGWVDDQASGESALVATMEMPPQTTWSGHSVDLGYRQVIPVQTCAQGLNKISIRYQNAVVNGNYENTANKIIRSNCIKLGAQSTGSSWSGGTKVINGEDLYALTIGN